MTGGLEDRIVHLNAESWLHAVQNHWHRSFLRPLITHSIEIEEALLDLRYAAGPYWPAVEEELERRAALIRTTPELTYIGVLRGLRHDVLAGHFPLQS